MTEKEIAELRRRIAPDKCNITTIRGCYVGEDGNIITEFDQSLGLIEKAETAELFSILKKVFSGQQGKNLIDIEFSNEQVVGSEEHDLLMRLRRSELNDDEAVKEFYQKAVSTLKMESKYIIILALDRYDVPSYSKDEAQLEDSDTVFSYILCAVCPVKQTKPALSYEVSEQQFKNIRVDWAISKPELGFMFPAFDDRQANIYDALYYIKNADSSYEAFEDIIFNTELPMPADEQKEAFGAIIEQTVSDDCDFSVMQNFHDEIAEMVEEHKKHKDEPPLTITKKTVRNVLEYCEVPQEKVEKFESEYDRVFGENAQISPKNIVDVKKFEMKTPDVQIKINPERLDLVKTKIIDGQRFILIRAESEVEVNGVNISIRGE